MLPKGRLLIWRIAFPSDPELSSIGLYIRDSFLTELPSWTRTPLTALSSLVGSVPYLGASSYDFLSYHIVSFECETHSLDHMERL